MRSLLSLMCLSAVCLANATELARETQLVDGRQVPVTSRDTIRMAARDGDADVKNRELWYRQRGNDGWGDWQRYSMSFDPETPIQWRPTEGHWQVYIRIEEISGLIMPRPDANTAAHQEFIVDRTPPSATITFPDTGTMLSGGRTYTITWQVDDPHLHSTPISLRWARSGDEDSFTTIAEHIANSGRYEWTTPVDMTAAGRLQLIAVDRAGNIATTASTNIVIDAVAPSARINGPRIAAKREVELDIRATDAGPAGLAEVALYFSANDGEDWTRGPTVRAPEDDDGSFSPTSLTWTAPADGSYLLYLRGADRADNVNPEPRKAMGDRAARLIIDTQAPRISLLSPIGVKYPDDKPGAPIRRVFRPDVTVNVPFQIQDANLVPGSVTVYLQPDTDAAWQVVAKDLDPDKPFSFKTPDIASRNVRIRVTCVDAAGNIGTATASEVFRIDNRIQAPTVTIDL